MQNRPSKILIVDDEPGLLFSLMAFLEDEGFHVQGTSSGEEALSLLQEEAFDAAIVDVRLPGKDGDDVILEAIETGCTANFIIHTGSADYQLPISLKKLGFTQEDIFLKPISDLDIICQALLQRIKKDEVVEK